MNDYSVLTKLFTRNLLSKIVLKNNTKSYRACADYFIDEDTLKTLRNNQVLSRLYDILRIYYRNEYYYKNTLINSRLTDPLTTTAIAEIPIAKSKVDMIIVDDTKAAVYEIKSDLDSFDRLSGQIADYYKAFRYVNILTCEKGYEKLLTMNIPGTVGLSIVVDDKIIEKRKATKEVDQLKHKVIFNILRKYEYTNIVKSEVGNLSGLTDFNYYTKHLEAIGNMNVVKFQKLMEEQLNKRSIKYPDKYKNLLAKEIKYLVYFLNPSKKQYKEIESFLYNLYDDAQNKLNVS